MCKVKCTIVSIYINKLARSLLPQMHMPHVMQDCHNFCLHILELWVFWSDVVLGCVSSLLGSLHIYPILMHHFDGSRSLQHFRSLSDPEKQQMLSKAKAVNQMKIIIVKTFSNLASSSAV